MSFLSSNLIRHNLTQSDKYYSSMRSFYQGLFRNFSCGPGILKTCMLMFPTHDKITFGTSRNSERGFRIFDSNVRMAEWFRYERFWRVLSCLLDKMDGEHSNYMNYWRNISILCFGNRAESLCSFRICIERYTAWVFYLNIYFKRGLRISREILFSSHFFLFGLNEKELFQVFLIGCAATENFTMFSNTSYSSNT